MPGLAAIAMPDQQARSSIAAIVRAAVIAVCLIVLATLAALLVQQLSSLRTAGLLPAPHRMRQLFTHPHATVPPTVDAIQPWMTFEYLNSVFSLSPETLRRALPVTDSRYPRLSIRRYAAAMRLSQDAALARVQSAIRTALASKP